jgi:hypothetical protein
MIVKTFENFLEDFNSASEWYPYSCKFKRKKFERKDKYENAMIYKVEAIDFKDKKIVAHHSATPEGYILGSQTYDGWNDRRIYANFDDIEIFPYTECNCPICLGKLTKKYNL